MSTRSRLSKELILETALRLVDDGGLTSLSMRRLGAELGVDPMAVYWHFANKRALVKALTEFVFQQWPEPDSREPWQRRVTDWGTTYLELGRAHSNLVLAIVGDPELVAVAAIHANEVLYLALEDAGLSPDDLVKCATVVVDYVNGVLLGEASTVAQPGSSDPFQRELNSHSLDRFPAQRRNLRFGHDGGSNSFHFGLTVILSGIASLSLLEKPGPV